MSIEYPPLCVTQSIDAKTGKWVGCTIRQKHLYRNAQNEMTTSYDVIATSRLANSLLYLIFHHGFLGLHHVRKSPKLSQK